MIESISDLERGNLEKYGGKYYQADKITVLPPEDSLAYADVLLRLRLDMVARFATNARVLDLCCGTGDHLLFTKDFQYGIGFDFSLPFLQRGRIKSGELGITNVNLVQGNARKLPFRHNYFDLIYSFSALYHIPMVEQVIFEASRVLKSGGICILDLGNLFSLNTIVCNAYSELAHPFHIPVSAMKNSLRENGLMIVEHRAFQILPMWADRPRWLRPLLLPTWRNIMSHQIRGKMLDELVSNLPVVKNFAFRQIFVCKKL